MLSLNIKLTSGGNLTVRVPSSGTVKELKQLVSKHINVPAENLRFILGGHVLPEDRPLQNCGVEDCTVLHAYQQRALPGGAAESQHHSSLAPDSAAASSEALLSQFLVFCKSCRAVRPGKLRVKCSVCKKETFIVGRDPQNWDDVLKPKCIRGDCQASKCANPFAEFYFKCREPHDSESLTGNAVVLHHIRPNRRQVECIACACVLPIILVYPCPDGHVICLECFATYGKVSLDQRSFHLHPELGYTLVCPGGCADSFIEESHHFRLLGSDQYERYQRFATEDSLRQANGVQCPQPGCGEGVFLEPYQTHVTCSACDYRYCRYCLEAVHAGDCMTTDTRMPQTQASGVNREQAQRAQWEAATREVIDTTTKPCPGCRSPTEKNGGCMHMRCSRCHMNWCWLCQTPWDRNCQEMHWFGD